MMTKRIIPCLDVDRGRVVKGTQFVDIRYAGDPVALAKAYAQQGADELVLLDITASIEHRDTMLDLVKSVAKEVFIPFTVGGGIRSIHHIRALLLAGADKVAINTAALQDEQLIRAAADLFGSQCIVLAMDVKQSPQGWRVYSHGGHKPTDKEAIAWATAAERLGAGEILLTSIDRDGTRRGYDLELLQSLTARLQIPVIASGGVGCWEDVRDAFTIGNADAALMASILHDGEYTIPELKRLLDAAGVAIRREV